MQAKSSSGYDKISSKLLNKIIDIFAVPLSFIFNESFTQGIFPDRLRIAKVIPIL